MLILLTVLATSCKKEGSLIIPNGTYTGTFKRVGPASTLTSNVTLSITGNLWEGESQYPKYPALCRGSFKISGTDQIIFENDCVWTADFDWTLILSQTYQVKREGNNLEIWRENNNHYLDTYLLIRQYAIPKGEVCFYSI